MATLQEQARALGDATRYAMFNHIAAAGRPVDIADLAERFGLHRNAIRQHLAKLVGAGLITESTARTGGRGRPRLVYALDPAAEWRWGATGPYERLTHLLLEVIRTGSDPEEVGRRAATQQRSTASTGDAVADITAAMARQGFEPETTTGRSGPEIVLHHCPVATAAEADERIICALHLGMVEGLAKGFGAVVDELVARDPSLGQCRLRLRTSGDGPGPGEPRLSVPQRTGERPKMR